MKRLKPILTLLGVNFLLFFCLGTSVFVDFTNSLLSQKPDIWVGNMSVASFGWFSGIDSIWLYVGVVGLLVLSFRKDTLLSLTCAALLLPSFSHDYKLPLLALPIIGIVDRSGVWMKFLLVFLFGVTLFSYVGKPVWLMNNFPVVCGILMLGSVKP